MDFNLVNRYFVKPELKKVIKAQGLTITGLTDTLGWSRTYIEDKFWKQQSMDQEHFDELCALLGVKPADVGEYFDTWTKLEVEPSPSDWDLIKENPMDEEVDKLAELRDRRGYPTRVAQKVLDIREAHRRGLDYHDPYEYVDNKDKLMRHDLDTYAGYTGDDDPDLVFKND